MQRVPKVSSVDVVLVRLGWFLHTKLKGSVGKVAARTGIASGTIRRYMDFDPARVTAGGSGPQKIPLVLRIVDALDVNPAKLTAAIYYSEDEATFRRLMASTLCIEERLCVQAGRDGMLKSNRRLIRLEPDSQPAGAVAIPVDTPRRRFSSGLLERLAWYVAERTRGRHEELYALTGIAPATLRRYGEVYGAAEGRNGPQKIRTFLKLLDALAVSPAKLVIAAHYCGDDDSFWTIMSSTICAEECLSFRGQDGQMRTERKIHRLDDSPGVLSRFPLAGGWNNAMPDGSPDDVSMQPAARVDTSSAGTTKG